MDEPIVCFDLETTGLSKETDVITEIGAVVLDHGEVKERFQTFVDPQRKLAPNIVQLTGITDEMLVGPPARRRPSRPSWTLQPDGLWLPTTQSLTLDSFGRGASGTA